MKLFLEMGCWGTEKNGLILCKGTGNKILDLTRRSKRNLAIEDYLDSHLKLFDRPLYNNIHTALFQLQDKFSEKGNPLFGKDYYALLEKFCVMHKSCGLYLKLVLESDET